HRHRGRRRPYLDVETGSTERPHDAEEPGVAAGEYGRRTVVRGDPGHGGGHVAEHDAFGRTVHKRQMPGGADDQRGIADVRHRPTEAADDGHRPHATHPGTVA